MPRWGIDPLDAAPRDVCGIEDPYGYYDDTSLDYARFSVGIVTESGSELADA